MPELYYCVKCKKKTEMKDAELVTMKNGKPALKGQCAICGANMNALLSKAHAAQMDRNFAESARECARTCMLHLLGHKDKIEEFWGNEVAGYVEDLPTRAEFDALVSAVHEAISKGQPLPDMESDMRFAFHEWLAFFADEVSESEGANTGVEGWRDAVSSAYLTMCEDLF